MDDSLLTIWSEWARQPPPRGEYIFPGDQEAIEQLKRRAERLSHRSRGTKVELTCNYGSWQEYCKSATLGMSNDRRLHLGLLPQPFCGDLRTARIVVLLLNPGLGPLGAFAQLEIPEYREALLQNLRGEPVRGGGFMHLNPYFAWHGAFKYWHGKLRDVIADLAGSREQYVPTRECFMKQFATLDLVPYHSVKFRIPRRIIDEMKSVKLARQFVQEVLLERAKKGACLIIVTRNGRWGLNRDKNVVVYDGGDAQAARLGRNSRGGQAIMEFLRSG